ncbi:hypothetical protein ADL03_06770 [Nocardia sp. NRRL S-836]|nr:hypothetical protein ADL03_06770 [Nocardia sp. NRRL S-836]
MIITPYSPKSRQEADVVPALLERFDEPPALSIKFVRWGGFKVGPYSTARWVAECHGEPVGFLAASIRSDGAHYGLPSTRCALLEGIAKLRKEDLPNCPHADTHTIASKLMDAFYEYARQRGARSVVLSVDQEETGLARRERRFRAEGFVQQSGTTWWSRDTPPEGADRVSG